MYFDRSISEDSSINVSIEHPHSYNYNYDNESNTKHKSYCECGEYILQDHNYVDYEKISDEYHTEICNCGYEHENQAHFEHRYGYTLFDTQNHNIYCICGHLIKTEKHNLRFLNGGSYCTLCGYEKKTGLDIMGKKEENMIM